MSRLRAAFMGSPAFAVPSLHAVHRRCDLQLVVCQPDRPAGRGRKLSPPAVKQAALELCDRVSETAARIGAVNTLRFVRDGERVQIHGDNTDARGFLDGLAELDGAPLRRATILGAGGASRAIVDALLASEPTLELTWVSRRPEGIPELDRVRRTTWDALGEPRGELLVNTTIVGLRGGPRSFPVELALDGLEPRARVVDIVYPRPAGGLLDRAQAAGLAVQDGLPMLLWQGVRALEIWLERALPDEAIAAMRAALGC